jgi:Cu(I)/Ag(I) efflux system membrane fusion protein
MKTKLPWILCALLAVALVVVAVGRPSANRQQPASAKKILYWVDPMHPQYKSDKPGKAPDCGMDLVPVYEGDTPPAGIGKLSIPPGRQQLIGVATGVAERRAIGRSIRTVGRVAVDETRLHKITTKFDGYIEKLYVDYTGKEVGRGQALFSVYSPDLLATQQEYLLALRAAAQSPALLDAARQRLRLWDISDGEVRDLERTGRARKSLTITSPASGVVMTKNAVQGAKVMAGEPLFEIAALDRVWVLADVYESELPFVRVGAPATITLSYIPGRTWTGHVTFIAPVVDPMTRTVKVRIELDNRDGALKPDMFADVVIEQPPHETTVVPDSAVLETGTRSLVFVAANSTFEPREVETGPKSDGFIEIRRGVAPGEKVVTQANFLIDSESRLSAVFKPETRNQKPEGAAGHAH